MVVDGLINYSYLLYPSHVHAVPRAGFRAMDSGFATATSTDSRSWLWVASFLSLIYSVLCLAARFTGKWDLLWWDDLILGAGYMASVVHWGFLFQALSDGVGVASIALTTPELSDAARVCEQIRHLVLSRSTIPNSPPEW